MAFVQRKEKNKFVFDESSNKSSSDKNSTQKTQQLKRNDFKREHKSYDEMTIETLNLLEAKGINIYDTNRFPGMYINKNGLEIYNQKNIINSLVNENNKSGDFIEDENKNNQNINELLNFFKQK